jgi:UDPglucose--hexose-1-phosphate uridylyltransferase
MKNRKSDGRSKSFVTPPSRRKIESLLVPIERIWCVPELRKDPIVGRWVIISTDRAKRPTDFVRENMKIKGGFCPFCYGNETKTPPEIQAYRPNPNGGPALQRDTPGWTVRVVPNKFPALGIEGNLSRQAEGMFDKMNGIGAHEVIIETPDHTASLATLPPKRIEDVLWTFRDRILDLKKDRRFKYILIFKNHGEAAGASLEHAHSQLIALPILPINVTQELEGSKQYFLYKERCVFCDIIRQETENGIRVVAENEDFLTLAPYAPRFPFETWILPKQHESAFENSSSHMFENLARALKNLLVKADRVLDNPPYNLVIHTSPAQDPTNDHYHWHIEFMPKLTKTAGFEWGTGFYINPTPPEEAAKFLREASIEDPVPANVG